MKKAVLMAKKLKGSVIPNRITMDEIIEEQKLMHKERISPSHSYRNNSIE